MNFGPEYHKIETFFNRDPATFRINTAHVRVPEFTAVSRWSVQEKLDGQNMRIHVKVPVGEGGGPIVTFNGRTDNAQLSGPVRALMEGLVAKVPTACFNPELTFEEFTLYGEAVGPKIQKNPHKLAEPVFVLFDMWVKTGEADGFWAPRDVVEGWAKVLGCWTPPALGMFDLTSVVDLVRNGFPVVFNQGASDLPAEGVICRPSHELLTQRGQRVIFKLKTKDFAAA